MMDSMYDRQVALFGEEAQEKLNQARTMVLGCGALGSLVANWLARAGVNLRLVDRDIVEESNLHRTLYRKKDVGEAKAPALKRVLEESSRVDIEAVVEDFNRFTWEELVQGVDLIVDCLDSMETRYLLNEVSIKERIPFVHGSAIREEGRSMTFVPENNKPCFECLYPEKPKPGQLETCHTAGVLNSITSLIASFQASEAMKYITEKGNLNERLFVVDLEKNNFDFLEVEKKEDCDPCGHKFKRLSGKEPILIQDTCDGYQIIPQSADLNLEEIAEEYGGELKDFFLILEVSGNQVILFENGRMQIDTDDKKKAKSIYSKIVGL